MRSVTLDSLSSEERELWEHFHQQRAQEIGDIVEGLADPKATDAIIWDEFLKHRWIAQTDRIRNIASCIRFMRVTADDGPDLRATARRHGHKSVLPVFHGPGIQKNASQEYDRIKKGTLYNFFFKIRYQDAKDRQSNASVRELTRDIAREWRELSDEQRFEIQSMKEAWEKRYEESMAKNSEDTNCQ